MSVESVSPSSKRDWTYCHFIIIALLMFAFPLLPAVEPITPLGMKMAGIFFGLLYGWSCCGMFWPSLLGLIAIGFSGLYPTVSSAVAAGIGNENVIFCILIFTVIEALNDCGLVKLLTQYLLTRRSIQGKVWRLVVALLGVSFALAAVGQAFAAMFLVWEMWYAIFAQVGYKPGDKFATLMIIATVLVMCGGGILMPFTNVPFVILSVYASIGQESINFARYLIFVIPVIILMFAEVVLIIKYVFKPDISKLQNVDMSLLVEKTDLTLTKRQKCILVYFLSLIVLLFLPGILPKTWLITQVLGSLGNAGICLIAIIAMTLTRTDGQSIFNFSDLARRAVSWEIFFFLAVIMMIAGAISNPATGISDFLKILLQPMLTIQSPYLFTVIFVALAFTLTNFMNNMVVGILFLPIIVVAGQTLGVNSWALVVLVIAAVNFSILTPAAAPVAGILFANQKWIDYRRDFKYIFIIFLAWGITLLTIGVFMANLAF